LIRLTRELGYRMIRKDSFPTTMTQIGMSLAERFADILSAQEPLAEYTSLRVGGRAQWFAEPRSKQQLAELLQACREQNIPWRILAGGTNVLVRDEGVPGLVCRLSAADFREINLDGCRLQASAATPLSQLITAAARQSLAGLENLIGIPGTIGGSLFCSLGSRSGPLTSLLHTVEFLDSLGHHRTVSAEEWLALGPRPSQLVVLSVELHLERDDPDSILRRLRRAWITRLAQQPFSLQHTARIFQEPRGLSLEQLFEQAGIRHVRFGGAELSERSPNFLVTHPGATARDVLRLVEHIRQRVFDHTGHQLQLELDIW
jgi:UDP-N-acetylmuramate dehydrogenase